MDLGALPWAQLGPAGILAMVVMLVMTGRIVPRQTLEDVRQDRDARLADKDREIDALRSANETLHATCDELTGHVTVLLEVARTAEHVLQSLPPGNGD